ncbi:Eukaryotic peptide chain release factor GTP-binding subunit ERF3B [Lemmus lemmus]
MPPFLTLFTTHGPTDHGSQQQSRQQRKQWREQQQQQRLCTQQLGPDSSKAVVAENQHGNFSSAFSLQLTVNAKPFIPNVQAAGFVPSCLWGPAQLPPSIAGKACCDHGSGSDLNNKKSRGHGGGHGGAQRIWVHSWLQCLWPFGQKETTLNQGSQAQDHTDQVEKDSAPKVPKEAAPEDMKEFVPNDQKVSCPNDPKGSTSKDTRAVQRDPMKSPFKSWDLLLDDMLTSMQEEDRHALITFMCTSSMNSTIQQVLDLLFRGIIRILLDTWIDEVPGDFAKTSELSILKKVKTYLMLNMLYADLFVSVDELHSKSKTSVQ